MATTDFISREETRQLVRAHIIAGRIEPGEPVKSDWIGDQFEIDRETVVVTLESLAAEGLITITGRQTPFASLPLNDERELSQFTSIRKSLECMGLSNQARSSGSWARQLDRLERACNEADVQDIAEVSYLVHFTILEMADCPNLVPVWRIAAAHTRFFWPDQLFSVAEVRAELIERHRQVFMAYHSGDMTSASSYLRELIDISSEQFRRSFEMLEVPVRIYVADDISLANGQRITDAAVAYLDACGIYEADSQNREIIQGSFFVRLTAGVKLILGLDTVQRGLKKVEEGLENHYVRLPDATISQAQAEAAARLIESLSSVDNAVVVIGPAILVKKTNGDAREMFIVPLTASIRERLEASPSSLASPRSFFALLEDVQDDAMNRNNIMIPEAEIGAKRLPRAEEQNKERDTEQARTAR